MDLQAFFQENPRVALAFSGGADSSYLFFEACRYAGRVRAYFVKTQFQPRFEYEDACRLAVSLGADLCVLEADVLRNEAVVVNPPDRCYHCKRVIFELLESRAKADGFSLIIDGTNASDDAGDRPGMRALQELSVRSPLRECGITKAQVRERSKAAGLFTWDKPAYACLATRIPTNRRIEAALLAKVEAAEECLFEMGFTDFRVRVLGDCARLQFPKAQMENAFHEREAIQAALREHFSGVLLDLNARTGE